MKKAAININIQVFVDINELSTHVGICNKQGYWIPGKGMFSFVETASGLLYHFAVPPTVH